MENFWDSLQNLVSTALNSDLRESLKTALIAGSSLTGADTLAIYLANEYEPGLVRAVNYGNPENLPQSLFFPTFPPSNSI